MFNKEQLKYLLDNTKKINYENFYKADLIIMIEILRERIDNAIEIIKSYNLGKYDFNIPTIGIIELLEILKGRDK